MERFIQFIMRLVLAFIALIGVVNIFLAWVVDKNPGKATVSTYTNNNTYDGIPDTSVSVNTSTEITSYNLFELSGGVAIVIALIFGAIIYFLFKDGFKAWSNASISMILGGFAVAAGAGIYIWIDMQELVSSMDVGEFSPSVGIACYLNLIISIIGFISIVIVKIIADKFDTSGEEKKGLIASIQEAVEKFQNLIGN
jgi:hypothetical protein